MKTIPLEDALKLASPAPLSFVGSARLGFSLHATMPDGGQSDSIAEVKSIALDSTKTNAALLAHFYNHGPELVKMLRSVLVSLDNQPFAQHPFPGAGGIANGSPFHEQLQELLAKASTVQMP